MNKFIVFFFAAIVLAQIDCSKLGQSRISSGFRAGISDVPCFASLYINFPFSDVYRTCGGCLIAKNKVVTSAGCVTIPEEGLTSSISFSFGSFKNIRPKLGLKKINIPTGYDYTNLKSGSNIAVITLNGTVTLNTLVNTITPSTNSTLDAYVGEDLFVCGVGDTDNDGNRPTTLRCTYLTVVPSAQCASSSTTVAGATTTAAATTTADTTTTVSTTTTTTAAGASTEAATTTAATTTAAAASATTVAAPTPQIICTLNINDANVCHGDEGSPVFSNSTGTLQFVGVVSHFPDVKHNAPCKDGHMVAITQVGSFSTWINS
ncbi:chymotrypsin-like elastase family member 1 [Chironomus tepperi]|uniref:chymotrypsin-like elastase family member 1 n=1 Tax=Chironomus tepperi TaxID=113505 RepID=UPI00391FB687